jgi:RNA polymerase sigma-70 factor (ECF subfamily)
MHDSTSWNLIEQAGAGDARARAAFAERYGPSIRAMLAGRWRGTSLAANIDDAVQELFVECLKPDGVLARADRSVPQGFRALLGAVARNVALRFEARAARVSRASGSPSAISEVQADATSLAEALDRRWAIDLVREAAALHDHLARGGGDSARLRVELLRLRFGEDLSIATIAERLGRDQAFLHHQYAKARRDFLRCLHAVLEARYPGDDRRTARERSRQLIELLRRC